MRKRSRNLGSKKASSKKKKVSVGKSEYQIQQCVPKDYWQNSEPFFASHPLQEKHAI